MRWILELSWLWKILGILFLSVLLCEGATALICKGLKKQFGAKAAVFAAVLAAVAAVVAVVCLSRIPALI